MASIKKITIGDSVFEWNTGKLNSLTNGPQKDQIMDTYKKIVYPNLCKMRDTEKKVSRNFIRDIVANAINNKEVVTMQDFMNLICTIRFTYIDSNLNPHIMWPRVNKNAWHTWWNIACNLNLRPKQTFTYCLITVNESYRGYVAIAYTDGENKDRKSSLDTWNERDMKIPPSKRVSIYYYDE